MMKAADILLLIYFAHVVTALGLLLIPAYSKEENMQFTRQRIVIIGGTSVIIWQSPKREGG